MCSFQTACHRQYLLPASLHWRWLFQKGCFRYPQFTLQAEARHEFYSLDVKLGTTSEHNLCPTWTTSPRGFPPFLKGMLSLLFSLSALGLINPIRTLKSWLNAHLMLHHCAVGAWVPVSCLRRSIWLFAASQWNQDRSATTSACIWLWNEGKILPTKRGCPLCSQRSVLHTRADTGAEQLLSIIPPEQKGKFKICSEKYTKDSVI